MQTSLRLTRFHSMNKSRPGPHEPSTGTVQLAEALTGDSSLVSLDVGGNNIGPEGIAALAGALRGNDALRTLELGYNPIREKGAQALADVVKYDLQVRAAGA